VSEIDTTTAYTLINHTRQYVSSSSARCASDLCENLCIKREFLTHSLSLFGGDASPIHSVIHLSNAAAAAAAALKMLSSVYDFFIFFVTYFILLSLAHSS
jgi:pectin methylesterase-like acyl-CoA thioesterase